MPLFLVCMHASSLSQCPPDTLWLLSLLSCFWGRHCELHPIFWLLHFLILSSYTWGKSLQALNFMKKCFDRWGHLEYLGYHYCYLSILQSTLICKNSNLALSSRLSGSLQVSLNAFIDVNISLNWYCWLNGLIFQQHSIYNGTHDRWTHIEPKPSSASCNISAHQGSLSGMDTMIFPSFILTCALVSSLTDISCLG